jgi:hypothetical protein
MCRTCWDGAGAPTIDNERVRAAVSLVREVYEWNGAGGNLHIVLDDWNTEDSNLDFCEGWIASHEHECSRGQIEAERACLAAFRAMTEYERDSCLGLRDGFWDENGPTPAPDPDPVGYLPDGTMFFKASWDSVVTTVPLEVILEVTRKWRGMKEIEWPKGFRLSDREMKGEDDGEL